MAKECINLPGVTGRPYSQAVKAGDYIFVSGTVGNVDLETGEKRIGLEAQTKQCLETIKKVLARSGATLDDVVKTAVFITRMADFEPMNKIYRTYFTKDLPARSTVVAGLVHDDMVVEIEAVAYKPQ